jgi:hypothetical protein
MANKLFHFMIFILICLSPASSFACSSDNPISLYVDSPLIFIGDYKDKGIEVNEDKAYNYYVFDVIESLKGSHLNDARVYYSSKSETILKNDDLLIVTSIGEGGRPYLHKCHNLFYDYSIPPGQSVYDFHHSVIAKLNLVVIFTALFGGFFIFIALKSHNFKLH